MRNVKKFLSMSFLLVVYVAAIIMLLEFYIMYQNSYQYLSGILSHESISTVNERPEQED